ncbi:hypothetical protein K2173_026817 [Erythroxylum novogranatense]|uniref:Pentatricopeptide repeat-containing protein n=1 Tax=Erythroxylum novogranatense TaxID=1862640 RepID=A0AAV8TXD7_9ROSI|nr:hypothetical protein K2173_026817 [Erythroxylum novogranatense]
MQKRVMEINRAAQITLKTSPDQRGWFGFVREHLSQGSPGEALVAYKQIRQKRPCILGLIPLILKACAAVPILAFGKSLHAEAIKIGANLDVLIGTSLIAMYAKCGDAFESRRVFDNMPEKNVVSWNAMIGGYFGNGDAKSALRLFQKMPTKTAVTWNEMISGFAKCGDLVTARNMFNQVPSELKNVVTWTVMVDGYASKGEMAAARSLFKEMPERNFFVWSSMISGYCKIGAVREARVIFDRIPVRNLVNWNALICGYVQNGFCEEGLEAFRNMQAEGFQPDEVTVVSVLSACAQLGLLDFGTYIHQLIYNKRMKMNQFVTNALVDMYAKCGDLKNARLIFEIIPNKNISCWNTIISGLAVHGQCEEALKFFRRMEESNVKPDEITFLSVLSACAHGGFANEGLETLFKMAKYGLTASIKHYGCVVDLLGRAGRLQDAYNLTKQMPIRPNDAVWGALLGACRIHMDRGDLVERVREEVSAADLSCYPHYVLLSNIYAAANSWVKAESMRMVMVTKGLQKIPGRSSIMLADTGKLCLPRTV